MQNFTVLKINYTSIFYKLNLNFKRNVSFIRCKRHAMRLFLATHRKLRNFARPLQRAKSGGGSPRLGCTYICTYVAGDEHGNPSIDASKTVHFCPLPVGAGAAPLVVDLKIQAKGNNKSGKSTCRSINKCLLRLQSTHSRLNKYVTLNVRMSTLKGFENIYF